MALYVLDKIEKVQSEYCVKFTNAQNSNVFCNLNIRAKNAAYHCVFQIENERCQSLNFRAKNIAFNCAHNLKK